MKFDQCISLGGSHLKHWNEYLSNSNTGYSHRPLTLPDFVCMCRMSKYIRSGEFWHLGRSVRSRDCRSGWRYAVSLGNDDISGTARHKTWTANSMGRRATSPTNPSRDSWQMHSWEVERDEWGADADGKGEEFWEGGEWCSRCKICDWTVYALVGMCFFFSFFFIIITIIILSYYLLI